MRKINKNITFKKEEKSLFVLPHLDDEFAMAPLIKKIGRCEDNPITIVYCAERLTDEARLQKRRRKECYESINSLGLMNVKIIFLNDHFPINDLKLYHSAQNIFLYLKEYCEHHDISQMITVSLEGGHPDHDALALIIKKLKLRTKIRTHYIPLYNNRKSIEIIPISVFRPLKNQANKFYPIKLSIFCWWVSIKIAMIYSSERKAFLKLFPFICIQTLFSKSILASNDIDFVSVNWKNSLTLTRYKCDPFIIFNEIEVLNEI